MWHGDVNCLWDSSFTRNFISQQNYVACDSVMELHMCNVHTYWASNPITFRVCNTSTKSSFVSSSCAEAHTAFYILTLLIGPEPNSSRPHAWPKWNFIQHSFWGFSLYYVQPNNFHVGRGICCSIHEAQPFSNPTRVPESRIFHFGLTHLKHPVASVVLSIITLFIIELWLGPVCVPNPLAFGDFHLCR